MVAAISLKAARQYLDQLDLSYVVETMCAERYPLPRWLKSDAEKCSELYKKFLFLQKKYPKIGLVPTREIDEFWHNHILYTKEYCYDCQQIFGYYLHHAPEPQIIDEKKLIQSFLETKALYLKEFKQPLILISPD